MFFVVVTVSPAIKLFMIGIKEAVAYRKYAIWLFICDIFLTMCDTLSSLDVVFLSYGVARHFICDSNSVCQIAVL